jgi:succinoglycan biosynthesis transport protein ExoP
MSNLLQHKQVKAFTQSLIEKRWLWIGTTCLFTVAALGYAMTKLDKWDATQSLSIRDEVVGSFNARGRFDSSDSMKAAQEMIVEVARSSEVLKNTLINVGPKAKSPSTDWPNLKDIEKLKGKVSVSSPHGTEFGTTEVFYLNVQSNSKERAVTLA